MSAPTPTQTEKLPTMRDCLTVAGVARDQHLAAMEAFVAWMRARCRETKP